MRATEIAAELGMLLRRGGLFVVASLAFGAGGQARADSPPAKPDPVALGYEIFNREWLPGDPRSHGGDGLGPVYNDTSCVACHNSGGSGGAGPVSKNIDLMHASRQPDFSSVVETPGTVATPAPPEPTPGAAMAAAAAALEPLLEIHAGFKHGRTVVLHRFGTDPSYAKWRSKARHDSEISAPFAVAMPPGPPILAPFVASVNVDEPVAAPVPPAVPPIAAAVDEPIVAPIPPGVPPLPATIATSGADRGAKRARERIAAIKQDLFLRAMDTEGSPRVTAGFVVTTSQRNPTALFGLGLIDAIPDAVLEAAAARQAKDSPAIAGRVSRLKDGRAGRLGWKGQTANVEDFVLNACAVEVGLEVPGHAQAFLPQAPRYKPPGLDLTGEECAALVAYVRSLPRPGARAAARIEEAKVLNAGKETFAAIGCAGCHTPSLGTVEGIYGDLLLHDLGQELADNGSYADSSDDSDDEPLIPVVAGGTNPSLRPTTGQQQPPVFRGARRQEWRTPPLWGFRDSGPYLHDGRAHSLEEAVAFHGGQGSASAAKYFGLAPRQRVQVEAFLKSLVAPAPDRPDHAAE